MVNRKLSHVPSSSNGQIDVMSRVLRTRSYQALLGRARAARPPGQSRAGDSIFACTPGFSAVSEGLGPAIFNSRSPVTSPFKDPSKRSHLSNSVYNPSFHTPAGLSRSGSQSSLGYNPHINPMIFDTPISLENTPVGSPSTVCSTLPTDPNTQASSSNKRPAKDIDVESEDLEEEDA
ncbi:uncharacterized protein MELLADRAFT_93490 [Melampsora larici-populina 98AG31]|uniref:Uncharacterized protein n=1 Tax=Melampsora larici-populina (strain 98AG31 / pathotype 3-4-7) TaxID=747676 RepID=F4RAK7_MELLP|nr:uncharacterized protein MELLADRAFT_93490 [Melampsora larici-populina 98AG31]EGG10766.1 hypothetical protein MELLADRAFT_93490 [Melampsora larici-populina 98AG31]